jgi:hypothetical protein
MVKIPDTLSRAPMQQSFKDKEIFKEEVDITQEDASNKVEKEPLRDYKTARFFIDLAMFWGVFGLCLT